MAKPESQSDSASPIEAAAAQWVLRLDRGLTATEQDDYSSWLAADPRHREALARHRWGWEELDRLAGLQTSVEAVADPDLLACRPTSRRGIRLLAPAFAVAVVAVAAAVWWSRPPPVAPVPVGAQVVLAAIEVRTLSDGSVVELNHGALLVEQFTAGERRVRLERGEAHFTVAKNPARPFIVGVGKIEVRAVGTAFNVRLTAGAVEVLVTEGQVRVEDPVKGESLLLAPPAAVEPPLLIAGQSAVVSLAPAALAPQVAVLSAAEIATRLAWQPRLLDFTAAPLADIVAEFNRHNPVRLVLGAGAPAQLRLSAAIRSDNVEGFVRLLESDFGLRVEWRGPAEIVLHPKR